MACFWRGDPGVEDMCRGSLAGAHNLLKDKRSTNTNRESVGLNDSFRSSEFVKCRGVRKVSTWVNWLVAAKRCRATGFLILRCRLIPICGSENVPQVVDCYTPNRNVSWVGL
ncbi:hypothetical protein Tco_0628502 [Tanacetum coccineum]|uniref:Uncharacterized protein n=1 Tax=Tanacetum coccineum TaxID=301880 RepID=A0ABQ4WQG5_9ASTR